MKKKITNLSTETQRYKDAGVSQRSFSFNRMVTWLGRLAPSVSLCLCALFILATCSDDPHGNPALAPVQAQLTAIAANLPGMETMRGHAAPTRATTPLPAPTGGVMTLTMTDATGTEKTAGYTWSSDLGAFIFNGDPSADRIIVGNAGYNTSIAGYVSVPYTDGIGDKNELISIAYAGPITTTVAADGATATTATPVTLDIQSSRITLLIKGAYGEGDITDARFIAILHDNIALHPDANANRDYTHHGPTWSYGNIAPQTIAAGKTILTLRGNESTGKYTPYENIDYTVAAPAGGFTFAPGKQYAITVQLEAGARTANIVTTGITPFVPADDVPGMKTRGILTADDLIQFAKEWNADRTAALARWSDDARTIRLLNDIDMTTATTADVFQPIRRFDATFAGGGHTISNLKTETTDDVAAFFFSIAPGGSVYGLHLADATIKGENSAAAGIAFLNDGTLTGCSVAGTVKSMAAYGITYNNTGIIAGCYANLSALIATGPGNDRYGIAQYNTGTIAGCAWRKTGTEKATFVDPGYVDPINIFEMSAPGKITTIQIAAMNDAIATHAPGTPVQWVYRDDNNRLQLEVAPRK